MCAGAPLNSMEAEVGRFEHCDCVCDEKDIAGEKPLVRDRALVFSPRAPWVSVPKISQNANKDAGDTAGGVWGGMPCRPPSVVCDGAICGDSEFFAKLRRFLLEVRTFFAENPQV